MKYSYDTNPDVDLGKCTNSKVSKILLKYYSAYAETGRENNHELLEELTKDIETISGSEHVMVIEVLYSDVLEARTYKLIGTNGVSTGPKEISDTDIVFDTICDGYAVISNDVENDKKSRGKLPCGYPKCKTLLGMPLFSGELCIGILLLANRKAYNRLIEKTLRPLCKLLVYVMKSINESKHNLRLKRQLLQEIQTRQSVQYDRDNLDRENKQKSMFLATMSHELRTPINGILGASHILSSDITLNDDQQEMVTIIRQKTVSLLKIINDILDYSDMESGAKIKLEIKPINIETIVREIVSMAKGQITEKKIELIVRMDPDLPKNVLTDGTKYGQILSEILSNAIKFTDIGKIIIAISGIRDRSSYIIKTSVRDTGIGIKKTDLDIIMQPFTQLDARMSRKYGGSGLGLSICQLLCKNMGGRIWAESPGEKKGAAFTFTISTVMISESSSSSSSSSSYEYMPSYERNNYSYSSIAAAAAATTVEPQKSIAPISTPLLSSTDSPKSPKDSINMETQTTPPPITHIPSVINLTSSAPSSPVKRGLRTTTGKRAHNSHTGISSSVPDEAIGNHGSASSKSKTAGNSLSRSITKRFNRRSGYGTEVNPQDIINTKQLHVLVVEDNKVNQIVLTKMLKKLDITFDVANNGQEGMEMVKVNYYDLVLMDIQMPVMDGHEATKKIRKFNNSIPIIAVTAHASADDKNQCMSIGMNDYMCKPIKSIDALHSIIMKNIGPVKILTY